MTVTEGIGTKNHEIGQVNGTCECPWCGKETVVSIIDNHELVECDHCDEIWAAVIGDEYE